MTESVVYIGNFEPPYSTENDVAHALETIGVTVHRVQESAWIHGDAVLPDPTDDTVMVLWTRTWPVAPDIAQPQFDRYRAERIPIVGYHLDVWWGLARQRDVYTDPFFRMVDVLYTADGGSDRMWASAGVKHRWAPPAVSTRNNMVGTPSTKWPDGVVFVGQTQPPYHAEWSHRGELLARVQRRYGRTFARLPHNNRAIRGDDLADVYATAAVVIGDSCFAGIRPRYWSDRVPETLGRGGLLIHPDTDWDGMFTPGIDMLTWRIGDWDGLFATIDAALANPERGDEIRGHGRTTVDARHTYVHRMERVLHDMRVVLR